MRKILPILTLRPKVTQGSYMFTTCFLMVINACAKFEMPMSKSKDNLAQTQIHTEIILLILRQRSRSYRCHECTQHAVSWWYTYVPNFRCLCQRAKTILSGQKFIEKIWCWYWGQGHTEVINLYVTLFHDDILMCRIYDYFKGQKWCGPNTKPCQKTL